MLSPFRKMIMCLLWISTGLRVVGSFSMRRRRISTAHKETLYSLNDQVCPPTDKKVLRTIVEKHCRTLDRYLAQKPISGHTQDAFDILRVLVANITATYAMEGIILDRFVHGQK